MFRPDTISMTVLLALLTAFGPLATDMYVPSMPAIGRSLGANASIVQLTLSAYLVGFAVGQIVYGPTADCYGRRPTLLVALVIFCAASLACAFAPTIETLIVARAFQALGGAGAIVLARAVVRDLYDGERAGQELSRMAAIMAFAPVIAPLIGGVVQTWFGWRANFIIIVGIGIIATLATWRSLPETLPQRSVERVTFAGIFQRYRTLTLDHVFRSHVGILACCHAGLFAWISGSPFVLQELYGLTPLWFGVAFGVACGGALAGGAIASSLVMRIGLHRTIGLGTLGLAAGGLAMVTSLALGVASAAALVIPMVIYHAGLMLAMPQAIAAAMTPYPHYAGTASSLIGVAQQSSAAVFGTIVGYMLGQSAWPLACIIAIMGSLSFVCWAGMRPVRTMEHRRTRTA